MKSPSLAEPTASRPSALASATGRSPNAERNRPAPSGTTMLRMKK
jgi:hypothetical protein